MNKFIEPLIYLVLSLYFHSKLLIKAIREYIHWLFETKIRLSIHTFTGAILAVVYFFVFTGRIEGFSGYHDASPYLAEYSGISGGSGIFIIAIASVLLITLTRGLFVFIGYTLIFWWYVIMVSFEPLTKITSI